MFLQESAIRPVYSRRNRFQQLSVIACFVGVLVTSACFSATPEAAVDESQPAAPAAASQSAEAEAPPPSADTPPQTADAAPAAASAPSPDVMPRTVVARGEGNEPGTWVEVTGLSRGSDGMVTLKFTLVNEGGAKEIGGYALAHPEHKIPDFGTVGGVYLLDARSMSKWDVGRDSAGKCICSEGVSVRSGQRMRAWAKFLSIPADTATVTIMVPGFEPIENVAISAPPMT